MKFKSFVIIFLCFFALAIPAAAQAPQEVTLTVSSDGHTKEDATKNALRSAIEQAYGAFVSANTTILNDELVKDEIVTVSNGSIKEYKEISAVQTGNGNHLVTLSATVSLPNLITYAKSHGSECEFAGNTFAINEKIRDMQYRNVEKILDNLRETILHTKHMFDYNLQLEEPELRDDKYIIHGKIYVMGNGNTLSSLLLMNNTIKELCKQIDPVDGYERIDGMLYRIDSNPAIIWMPKLDRNTWSFNRRREKWFDGTELLRQHAADFQLLDNISSPTNLKVFYGMGGTDENPHKALELFDIREWDLVYTVYGYGSLKKPYKQADFEKNCTGAKKVLMSNIQNRITKEWDYRDVTFDPNLDFPISYSVVPHEKYGEWAIQMVYCYYPIAKLPITLEIPKEDIGKYSSFKIEPKE